MCTEEAAHHSPGSVGQVGYQAEMIEDGRAVVEESLRNAERMFGVQVAVWAAGQAGGTQVGRLKQVGRAGRVLRLGRAGRVAQGPADLEPSVRTSVIIRRPCCSKSSAATWWAQAVVPMASRTR
ncbi:MAG: hypothetical protein QOH84_5579 [Kribbellaceae bacterium]|nr:hypothetical protein [Kribbellaceae bacterium]